MEPVEHDADGQPSAKKRRTKTGCRAGRKKCSETGPPCEGCIRKGLVCQGFGSRVSLSRTARESTRNISQAYSSSDAGSPPPAAATSTASSEVHPKHHAKKNSEPFVPAPERPSLAWNNRAASSPLTLGTAAALQRSPLTSVAPALDRDREQGPPLSAELPPRPSSPRTAAAANDLFTFTGTGAAGNGIYGDGAPAGGGHQHARSHSHSHSLTRAEDTIASTSTAPIVPASQQQSSSSSSRALEPPPPTSGLDLFAHSPSSNSATGGGGHGQQPGGDYWLDWPSLFSAALPSSGQLPLFPFHLPGTDVGMEDPMLGGDMMQAIGMGGMRIPSPMPPLHQHQPQHQHQQQQQQHSNGHVQQQQSHAQHQQNGQHQQQSQGPQFPTPSPRNAQFQPSPQESTPGEGDTDMLSFISKHNSELIQGFYHEVCATLAPFTPAASGGSIGTLLAEFSRPQSPLHLLMLAIAAAQGKLPVAQGPAAPPLAGPLYHLAVARLAACETADGGFVNSDEHLATIVLGTFFELFDTGMQDMSIGWLKRAGLIVEARMARPEPLAPNFIFLAQLFVWVDMLSSCTAIEPQPQPASFEFLDVYTASPDRPCVFQDVQIITSEVLKIIGETSVLISARKRNLITPAKLEAEISSLEARIKLARLPARASRFTCGGAGYHPFHHHACFEAIVHAAQLHLQAGLLRKDVAHKDVKVHVDRIIEMSGLLPDRVNAQPALCWPIYMASLHISTDAQMTALASRIVTVHSVLGQLSAMGCWSAAEAAWAARKLKEHEPGRTGNANGGEGEQGFRRVLATRRWHFPLWF